MAFAPPPRITYNNFYGQYNILVVGIRSQPINSEAISNNMLMLLTQKQTIFAFTVSALLSILQLKYGGNEDSPFVTHPKTMGMAVVSVLVYCLACDAELRMSSTHHTPPSSNNANATIIHHLVRLLGYCSLASLASVLALPLSVPPLAYFALALFSVWLLLYAVHTRILMIRQNATTMRDLVNIDTLPV